MMTYADFIAHAAAQSNPPGELPPALAALWHAQREDWELAHQCAQQDESDDGSWVHAHLHREEGDLANADYWYRRARRPRPATTLPAERETLIRALLETDTPGR